MHFELSCIKKCNISPQPFLKRHVVVYLLFIAAGFTFACGPLMSSSIHVVQWKEKGQSGGKKWITRQNSPIYNECPIRSARVLAMPREWPHQDDSNDV